MAEEDTASLECTEDMQVESPKVNGLSKDATDKRASTPKSEVEKNGHDDASVSSSEDRNSSVIGDKDSGKGADKSDVIVLEDTPLKEAQKKEEDCIVLDDDDDDKATKQSVVPKVKTKASKNSSSNSSTDSLRPMAKVLCDLGLDLARQQVYKDLIKIQNKKDSQQKLGDKEKKQLDKLVTAYDNIVTKNEPFHYDMIKCKMCHYNTESENVLELHREYAHHPQGSTGQNTCECSFCEYATSYPGDFFIHMENVHKKRGRIQTRLTNFACYYCSFETNARKPFQSHIMRCERSFRLRVNLMPAPGDSDIPLKPDLAPIQKNPAAPIAPTSSAAKHTKPGMSLLPPPTKMTSLPPGANTTAGQLFKVGNQLFTLVHSHGQAYLTPYNLQNMPMPAQNNPRQPTPTPSILKGSGQQKKPGAYTVNEMLAQLPNHQKKQPRQPKVPIPGKPIVPKMGQTSNTKPRNGSFEVCEICGGFVRDKESLRIHFFYAHKVEFPADMFSQNKPSLFCDVCKQRFWTYQGLVRHSTQMHGTGASNKNLPNLAALSAATSAPRKKTENEKSAVHHRICCHICGESNLPGGLLRHMVSRHKLSIRRMSSNLCCFLCRRKFKLSMGIRMHMQKAHKELFSDTAAYDNFLKTVCPDAPDGTEAPEMKGFKCSRCPQSFPMEEVLVKHHRDVHRNDKDPCPLCGDMIVIGRPFIRHVKSEHCAECFVSLNTMPKAELDIYVAKYKAKENEATLKRKSEDDDVVVNGEESDKENHKRRKLIDGETEEPIEVDTVDKEPREDLTELTAAVVSDE